MRISLQKSMSSIKSKKRENFKLESMYSISHNIGRNIKYNLLIYIDL